MNFRQKVLLVVVLASVPPVLLLGWLSWGASREELSRSAARTQTQAAQQAARETSNFVFQAVDNLRLFTGYLPFDQLSGEEIGSVLAIPYRQLKPLTVVALLDEQGTAVAPAVFARPEAPVAGRESLDAAALEAFAQHVPLDLALSSGAAVGTPYRSGDSASRVVLAVKTPGTKTRLLAAELSLATLQERVEELSLGGGFAFITDAAGAPLAHGTHQLTLGPAEQALVERGRALQGPATGVLEAAGGEYVAAWVPIKELGWGLLVGERTELAFAPAERVRRYTMAWVLIALVAASLLGVFLAREVTRPIARLAAAVKAVGEARYDDIAPLAGQDELAALGTALRSMAGEIRRRDDAIRGQNRELEARVLERTRELKEALDQASRARRMAALGSLSAGFAHEMNNPLTGILGIGSMLKTELKGTRSEDLPELLLKEARQVAAIVAQLRQLVDAERTMAGTRFPVQRPIVAAMSALKERLELARVTLVLELPPAGLEVDGWAEQLQSVVDQLARNALVAMKGGGRLVVRASRVDDTVRVAVQDTGVGIPPELQERVFDPFFTTKAEPTAIGLGLSVAHRLVENHHGQLRLESVVGKGTTVTLILPCAGGPAHLV